MLVDRGNVTLTNPLPPPLIFLIGNFELTVYYQNLTFCIIIIRTATDCEWGHYQMVHAEQDQDDSSDTSEDNFEIPQKCKDKQIDPKADQGSKILHFKTGAPANKGGEVYVS